MANNEDRQRPAPAGVPVPAPADRPEPQGQNAEGQNAEENAPVAEQPLELLIEMDKFYVNAKAEALDEFSIWTRCVVSEVKDASSVKVTFDGCL
ncbi:hypothetical protein AC249_AIPGENE13526 [Exaiptasia diaphana]|nr:hypothetical protein AC249_AIPGENE13526 [Exaiptasia diaphana]